MMKLKMEVECTPEEARTFLGLPDVTALNKALTEEMQARMKANMAVRRAGAGAVHEADGRRRQRGQALTLFP
jgi:hypothetical protein